MECAHRWTQTQTLHFLEPIVVGVALQAPGVWVDLQFEGRSWSAPDTDWERHGEGGVEYQHSVVVRGCV